MNVITVAEMVRRLDTLDNNFESLVQDSLIETKEDYAILNTEQMYEGKDNEGNAIIPEYAESTKRIKKRKGQPTDRVTLRDTGEYHKDYTLTVEGDSFTMGSRVEYEQYIDKKYKKIYGLDPENKGFYVEQSFWPVLKEKIEDITKLSFIR